MRYEIDEATGLGSKVLRKECPRSTGRSGRTQSSESCGLAAHASGMLLRYTRAPLLMWSARF